MMSTLLRKNIMALTGLFLCLFLVVHLLGNLQLLLPPEEAITKFNGYSKFMTGNPIIKVVSYLLYASIVLHSLYAAVITWKNRQSSGGTYAYDRREKSSRWAARNMGFLGTVLLLFLIIHLKDFWYQYKWGHLPLDASGYKDLYSIVIEAYGRWWYVALNLVAFVALGFHLWHGFYSAFKSLGAYPGRLAKVLYGLSIGLTSVLTFGFIVIPIYVWLKFHS